MPRHALIYFDLRSVIGSKRIGLLFLVEAFDLHDRILIAEFFGEVGDTDNEADATAVGVEGNAGGFVLDIIMELSKVGFAADADDDGRAEALFDD